MTVIRHAIAVGALALAALAAPAYAQDEEEDANRAWRYTEEGAAEHDPSGSQCPAALADFVLDEVLSFDRGEEHLGIGCIYVFEEGGQITISILRSDVEELMGPGGPRDRWNALVLRIFQQHRNALPAPLGDLGPDESVGMRAAMAEIGMTGQGPIKTAIWAGEAEGWFIYGNMTFVDNDEGRVVAGAARDAIISILGQVDG